MSDSVLAWHFLSSDRHTRRDVGYPPPILVEVGQMLTEIRPLELCNVGLHASIRAIDAMRYAPGPVVCRVRLSGAMIDGHDKICATTRTVLAMEDATALLHEFACWCADKVLCAERKAGREPDARSWAVVEAKRAWMRGEIDDHALTCAIDNAIAAMSYARDATSAAAMDSVRDAARSAANAAAMDAARGAANAASSSAWNYVWGTARGYVWVEASAAANAAWAAQNTELESRLLALLGIER